MNKAMFKHQIDTLYEKNHKQALVSKLYAKKDFMEIASLLFEGEIIEAVAPICDHPNRRQQTKLSFIRNWYLLLTNKRILFASPTLVLKEMESFSYKYSNIISAEASAWNFIKIKINSSLDTLSIGGFLYYEQRDEILKIIQKYMFS
ncbi:MAG: PH domain-containing protein [Ruminococcus sp.]|nr:PH domain-containing protein [Ruminococcus sp.]